MARKTPKKKTHEKATATVRGRSDFIRNVKARALAIDPMTLLALFGGGVFALTSPPIDFHLGIVFGLGAFAYALEVGGAKTLKRGALYGWLFGVGANLVALRFVPAVVLRFTPLPPLAAYTALILLAAAQAVPWAVGAAIAHAIPGRVPGVPRWLAFAFGVYVASFVPVVFPWTPAGGLTPWPIVVQMADMIGERGVSLLVAMIAALIARAIAVERTSRRAAVRPVVSALAVAGVMLAYGAWRMKSLDVARDAAPHAKIALVQPGFAASDRWEASRATMMIERLTKLTKNAERRGADLTVWPESAYPFTLPHGTRTSPFGERAFLGDGVHGPVLTGVYMSGSPTVGFNSAVLVTEDGVVSEPYDKRHLLAFGEAVPFGETFPWLKRTFVKGSALAPGTDSVLLTHGPMRMAVLNCFEDTLPEAGREAMTHSPNVLVNITNDAWFIDSPESELHLRLAVLRAVETRRDLVRAVNQGPTTFVDATGRVRGRYDVPFPGSFMATPALLELPNTFYVRFGDVPVIALLAASVLVPFVRNRRRDPRAVSETP